MTTKITKDQINGSPLYLLKKIHLILGIAGFVLLQLGILYGAYYKSENHIGNKVIHRTYEDNSIKFVTRKEYEALVETLKDVSEDVKWIRRNL